jgi:uncharacterized protein (DUF433 family)
MSYIAESRPRSFRVPVDLLDELDAHAERSSESANALAVRLIAEGLRLSEHPLVYFRVGGSGIRRPALVGTRLDLWQVIATLRANGNDVASTAKSLQVSVPQVRAAVQYYAEYADEIDAFARDEQAFADRERERWERAQRVLA